MIMNYILHHFVKFEVLAVHLCVCCGENCKLEVERKSFFIAQEVTSSSEFLCAIAAAAAVSNL